MLLLWFVATSAHGGSAPPCTEVRAHVSVLTRRDQVVSGLAASNFVAELNGNLFDYHIHWDPSYFSDTQLVSEKSCVWDRDDFERLTKLRKGSDPGGKFIIVQSHARIPLERVRDYCLSFAG